MKLTSGQRAAAFAALTGAGVALVVIVLFALAGLASGQRPVFVPGLAAAALLSSLAIPCVSILFASKNTVAWLRSWSAPFGGAVVAMTLLSLPAGGYAAGHMLLSLVVVGAVAFAYGALTLAVRALVRSARAAAMTASLVLVAMIAVPFWSGGMLRTGTGLTLGTWLVRLSPSLSAGLPWIAPTSGWSFDPRTSNVLYDLWVGTDVPLALPSWYSSALLHLAIGAVLLAAGNVPALARALHADDSASAPNG